MKKLLIILAAAVAGLQVQAQESEFNKGDLVFNAGIGFGTTLWGGIGYSSTLPPISISGEYGIIEDFITSDMTLGVGGYVGIAGSEFSSTWFGNRYGWRYTYTVIGVRGVVHYPLVDKLDTYGGLMLSYNSVSAKEIGDFPAGTGFSAASGGVGFSLFVGGRYYFTERLAGMMELGYGIAYVNLGVAFKI